MCDLLVAMPDVTRNKKIIFGKNSDRPAGECQVLYYSPGHTGKNSERINCSYLSIPQADNVLATLGCRPYWCWGYETGMNEAGVVAGNAAIYTRSLRQAGTDHKPGLTGMDLLRLGLERGASAEQMVDVITDLLEQFGQWGSAVQGKNHEEGSYENAFLIADKGEAWVLETSGRRWVAERTTRGIRTLSNQPSIRDHWTKGSKDLQEFAEGQGWWQPDQGSFDFAYHYGDHEHYSRQVSHLRWKQSRQMLQHNKSKIDVRTMMGILRDHYEDTFLEGPQFHPFLPDFLTLCMHESPAKFTWGNTATSVVVEMDPDGNAASPFWLCYLPPCCGIYLAYFLTVPIPDAVKQVGKSGLKVTAPHKAPKDEFLDSSLWWRCQRLIGEIAKDPDSRGKEVRTLFDPLEKHFLEKVRAWQVSSTEIERKEMEAFVEHEVSKFLEALDRIEKSWKVI